MKKDIRVALQAVSVSLLLAAGSTSMASNQDSDVDEGKRHHRGGEMQRDGDGSRMVAHLARKLDIDATQQQAIEEAVAAVKPDMDALRERARSNRQAIHELDREDDADGAKRDALIAEKNAIAAERAMLHARLKEEIDAVLTVEQREQLATLAERKRDRPKKRRGRPGDQG